MEQIRWEKYDKQYSSGDAGFLGKWKIFTIFWMMMSKTEKDNPYCLNCDLPGIKNNIGHFPDIDSAKEKATKVIDYWLTEAKCQNK
jgi:hypothetical protein